MTDPNLEKPVVNAKVGTLLFLMGSALFGYFVVWAIWLARHNAPEIPYDIKGAGMGLTFMICGTMMLITPKRTAALMTLNKTDLKLKDVLFLGGLSILGLALIGGMDLYFSSLGYR